MRKLQAFTTFLMNSAGIPRENISSFADKGETTLVGEDLGHGVELCRFKYDGVVDIKAYAGDAHLLLALLVAWLNDNDADRAQDELADPDIHLVDIDGHTADVQLSVEFYESVQIVPGENGPILFNGKKWRMADVSVDVAKKLGDFEGSTGVE